MKTDCIGFGSIIKPTDRPDFQSGSRSYVDLKEFYRPLSYCLQHLGLYYQVKDYQSHAILRELMQEGKLTQSWGTLIQREWEYALFLRLKAHVAWLYDRRYGPDDKGCDYLFSLTQGDQQHLLLTVDCLFLSLKSGIDILIQTPGIFSDFPVDALLYFVKKCFNTD